MGYCWHWKCSGEETESMGVMDCSYMIWMINRLTYLLLVLLSYTHTERQRQWHQCKSVVMLQNQFPTPIFKRHNAFQWTPSAADTQCRYTLRVSLFIHLRYTWGEVSRPRSVGMYPSMHWGRHSPPPPPPQTAIWNFICQKSSFDKSLIFSHLVQLFLQKRFLCVKLQYLVSTYLQLDCLYHKKQIYSETFCYPTPMWNFVCQNSSFD